MAAQGDAHYKQLAPLEIEIESGTVLIEALKAISVTTPLCKYQLKPKSLVLLRIGASAERALAMLESVTVVADKRSTELRFGEEALVSVQAPSASELVGEEGIGIRQVRQHQLGENLHIAIMEYSLIQATERIELVKKIVHSESAHDKALRARLLKALAVLNVVTTRHGQYSGGR